MILGTFAAKGMTGMGRTHQTKWQKGTSASRLTVRVRRSLNQVHKGSLTRSDSSFSTYFFFFPSSVSHLLFSARGRAWPFAPTLRRFRPPAEVPLKSSPTFFPPTNPPRSSVTHLTAEGDAMPKETLPMRPPT